MKNLRALTIIVSLLIPSLSYAWDGYDYEKGSYVEIDKGNLVRSGNDIEVYDYSDGEYKTMQVESINSYGSSVELEIYDYDSGEYRTLEMDN